MRYSDKGFNSNAVLTIAADRRLTHQQVAVFAAGIRHLAGVEDVILQGTAPMGIQHSPAAFVYRGKGEVITRAFSQSGDEHFIPFYRIRIEAGRNLYPGDSTRELVINNAYARALGFASPREAVGQLLYSGAVAYTVVGVIADFHEEGFHDLIKPLVLQNRPEGDPGVAIRLVATSSRNDARLRWRPSPPVGKSYFAISRRATVFWMNRSRRCSTRKAGRPGWLTRQLS